MAEYSVTPALMRGTFRWFTGRTNRRELRKAMLRAGWYEPDVSNYLDMVRKAMFDAKKEASW